MATTDTLRDQILARCFWPSTDGQAPLSHAEILSFADAEIVGTLWPDVLATQGDYYVDTLDFALTVDVSRYRLPPKSYGPIKDVLLVDDDDDADEGESVPLINLEDLGHSQAHRPPTRYASFIEGDYLGITPAPSQTDGTLRIRYYRHPSALCLTTAARQITGADLETGVFGATDGDDIWSAGDALDIVSAGNAHQVLVTDVEIDSVNATEVDFAQDLTGSGVQVDDWLATAGTTPIVQVPDSMIPLLAYRTALACLSAAGDRDGFALCMQWGESAQLEIKQRKLLEPRSESEPRSISTAHSALWLGRTRGVRAWRS